MGWIHIEDMEFYAYHGHFKEEQIAGNKFLVNLDIQTDTDKPGMSDDLEDALNYQEAYEIISKQMDINSFLLEHVANRIMDALYDKFKNRIQHAILKVTKLNPPVGGRVKSVSVSVER